MKKINLLLSFYTLLGILALFLAFRGTAGAANPPRTVSRVDLNRYMGTWYEIAAIPTAFQRRCVSNTFARYNLLPGGEVRVINSCRTETGETIASEGRARVEDIQSNAKLRVTFANLLGWRYLLGGDYWVIDLDEGDYSFAVVGHPSRRYGWILSRTPDISLGRLRVIADRLRGQGYDTCDFIVTPQTGGLSSAVPLCETVRTGRGQPAYE